MLDRLCASPKLQSIFRHHVSSSFLRFDRLKGAGAIKMRSKTRLLAQHDETNTYAPSDAALKRVHRARCFNSSETPVAPSKDWP
jgi:hypothetical protein